MGRPWQLPYLGNRDYVHGTTIVDRILTELQPGFPLDVRFQSPIFGTVDVQRAPTEKPNVAISFDQDGQRVLYGLFDAGNAVLNNRLAFDEGAIARAMMADETAVRASHDSGVSLIARIVVMNKTLMARMFSSARGKWWFAGLWLQAWPTAVTRVEVELDRGIGTKLVRSTVRADGDAIGKIFFSLREAGNS
jgi:hypothetical protein